MKIYTCESCRYRFRYPLLPMTCPDCGKRKIRPATSKETQAFYREQKILAEEIRQGLYAGI